MGVQRPEAGHRDEARSGPDTQAARLLVVDDEPRFATLLGDLLEAMGYAVDIATNGTEALALFRADPPAAILLDLRMPGMDGPEVFDAIRRIDATVPIIIVSGIADERLARTMLHRGAFDYVRKPLDVDHLQVVVAAATTTPWPPAAGAEAARVVGSAQALTRLPYALVGLMRHLPGRMHPGREQLEALALEALREAQLGRQESALDALRAIRRLLDAGRLGWLAPPDAETLRAVLAPLEPAVIEPPAKVFRIGGVLSGPLAPRAPLWDALRDALRDLGWIDGENVQLELRTPDREGAPVDDLVDDLVRRDVDVIVASPDVTVQTARRATRIPVVSTGIVDRNSPPDRNVTGVAVEAGALNDARLQLLNAMVPGLSRVAILVAELPASGRPAVLETIEAAARALDMEILVLEAPHEAALETTFAAAAGGGAGGMIVLVHEVFLGLRTRIAELAIAFRVPTISGLPRFADAGGLAAYAANAMARYRQAAGYVDKILRGATPAELPMEPPGKLDLVVNLKTAKALGLVIPRTVVLRADRVIE